MNIPTKLIQSVCPECYTSGEVKACRERDEECYPDDDCVIEALKDYRELLCEKFICPYSKDRRPCAVVGI